MKQLLAKYPKLLPTSILALLSLEFILGTLASMYQEVPEGIEKYTVYKPAGLIFFHVVVAMALFVLGLAYMIRTKMHNSSRKAFGASIGGFTCIVIALILGVVFVDTANDIYAFLMMFFGLGALLSYAQIVYGQE